MRIAEWALCSLFTVLVNLVLAVISAPLKSWRLVSYWTQHVYVILRTTHPLFHKVGHFNDSLMSLLPPAPSLLRHFHSFPLLRIRVLEMEENDNACGSQWNVSGTVTAATIPTPASTAYENLQLPLTLFVFTHNLAINSAVKFPTPRFFSTSIPKLNVGMGWASIYPVAWTEASDSDCFNLETFKILFGEFNSLGLNSSVCYGYVCRIFYDAISTFASTCLEIVIPAFT